LNKKSALNYLEIFFLLGLFLRFLISGRIYYWSNYLFLIWFSLAYLLALLAAKSSFSLPGLLKLGLGLFFAGLILSMPFGIQPLSSARELVIFLTYLFIFLSGLEILSESKMEKLILIIILSALIHSLMGFRQYFGGLESLIEISGKAELAAMEQIRLKRVFGLTFSPDFFSGFLAPGLILLIGCAGKIMGDDPRRKTLNLLILLLIILLVLIPMFLSKSIGGFLSFLLGILALMLLRFSKTLFSKKTMLALLAALCFGAAIFSLFIYHRRAVIFQSQSNPVLLRLYNFQAGFRVYLEKPVFGVGLGNFWIAYPKYRQPQSNEVRYAHNNFIQVLAEAGPVAEAGLMIIILYLLLALKKIRLERDPVRISLFCALLALWSHWLWDFGLYAPELASVFFALLAAITVKIQARAGQKISRLTLSLLGFLLIILWILAGWLFAEQRMAKNAERFFIKGDLQKVSEYARKAVQLIPDDDYPYTLLAFIAMKKGENESTIADYYQKAIQLNPRFAFWHRDLGNYYFENNQINSAQAEYLRALKLYPNSIDLLIRLARLNRLKGNLPGAENYAQKALSIIGDHRSALWELAKIKLAKDEREEMLEILKELSGKYQDPEAKKLLEKYQLEELK